MFRVKQNMLVNIFVIFVRRGRYKYLQKQASEMGRADLCLNVNKWKYNSFRGKKNKFTSQE